MKFLAMISLICSLVFTHQVNAAATLIDFEGLQDREQILDFYNGGTGSLGSSGADIGISFSEGALALIDSDSGGIGNFANEPSGDTIAFWQSGDSIIMNINNGFTDGFSFFYTSFTTAEINIWSGLNATGSMLGTLMLSAQYNDNCSGDPTGVFCNWSAAGLDFAGTALSIDFGGTANNTGYDNITLGSSTPINTTPIPAAVWLFISGILGVSGLSRRKTQV